MRFAAILAFTAVTWAQQAKGPAGHWEGALDTPNGAMKLELDFARDSGGAWMGTISLPAQGTKGLALMDVAVKENSVAFKLKAPGDPLFQGKLSEDGTKISGDLTQGGATIPFDVTRTGDARIEKPAVNAPLSADLEGTWEGTLDAGGAQLRLRFVLQNVSGAGKGHIISIDQGGSEIPISKITQAGSHVSIEVPVVSGAYEGELKGNQITGEWTQAGKRFPALTLTKKPAEPK